MQKPVIATVSKSAPRLLATPILSMLAVGKEGYERRTSSRAPRELIHDSLPEVVKLVGVVDLGRVRSAETLSARENRLAAWIVNAIKLGGNFTTGTSICVHGMANYRL